MNVIQLTNNTGNSIEFRNITFDDAVQGFVLAPSETKTVLNTISEFWINDEDSIFTEISTMLSDGDLSLILDGYTMPINRVLDVFKSEIVNISYKPTFAVSSVNSTLIPTNKTGYEVVLKGTFLDYVSNVSATGNVTGSIVVNSLMQSYDELRFNIDTLGVETITISLTSVSESYTVDLTTANIDIYIPDTGVSSPSLWVKSSNNNNAIVGYGTFEAENSGGNGWNEHAYFGAFSSSSRIEFNMDIDRLSGASSAYCYIRFNNTNTPSAAGNPRIYIQNRTTLYIYNNNGGSTTNSVSEGDNIKVVLTTTGMQVLKNDDVIYSDSLSYNLTNIYPTFTAYRVFKASNISIKVFQ